MASFESPKIDRQFGELINGAAEWVSSYLGIFRIIEGYM